MRFLISLYQISKLAEPALMINQLDQLDYDKHLDMKSMKTSVLIP